MKSMIKHILQNADEINKLHQESKEAFKNRNNNEQAWRNATQLFHNKYNTLAFPGGLERGIDLLKQQDPSTIDLAITYLEANPYYFRSGYIKEKIAHILKKAPLTHEQKNRLQRVILTSVHDKDLRKLKAYCELAKIIADNAWHILLEETLINKLGQSAEKYLVIVRDR